MDIKAYLEELRELVDIDSGTSTVAGVSKVASILAGKYKALGWHAECVDLGNAVGNGMFATNKPNAKQYDALLIGHMDTVFPAGTVAQRPMSTDDTNAYGPGVADMKAGCLSMVWAVKGMEKADLERMSIAVALNPDEEIGSNHSSNWLDELAKKSRYVFVVEPSRGEGGQLVKARKGMARVRFDFKGLASHAGNAPDVGRSAVHEMAHFIIGLAALADKEKGLTANVGLAAGGDAPNIIADKASCTVDFRYWHNEHYTALEKVLKKMSEKSTTPDVDITMTVEAHLPSMYPSPEMEAFMKIVETCGTEVGVKVIWQMAGGGSDANHIAPLGIPVLDGFGPVGGNFHSPKEFLDLASIEPRINLLRKTMLAL